MTKWKFFYLSCLLLFIAIFVWLLSKDEGVPILAYHSVRETNDEFCITAEEFENQMRYLDSNGYTTVSLNDMIDAFEGKKVLPSKPVILTFDDGYRDNYLVALPIMQKYHMKATEFVITGSVGGDNYLTWDQIKALQNSGIEIGSHTVSHLPLRELSLQEKINEVVQSKRTLEEKLSTAINFLAYPYGSYDRSLAAIMQEAGYHGACGGRPGLNFSGKAHYALHRVNIPNPKFGIMEFKARLWRGIIFGKFELLAFRLLGANYSFIDIASSNR